MHCAARAWTLRKAAATSTTTTRPTCFSLYLFYYLQPSWKEAHPGVTFVYLAEVDTLELIIGWSLVLLFSLLAYLSVHRSLLLRLLRLDLKA